MSKWYVALLSVVVLFSLYVLYHNVGYKADNQKFISIDSLESRVFAQYGEGDAGVEEMLYLTTGVKQDFMGNPDSTISVVKNYDYFVCLNDSFTVVYDIHGKFVTLVPYVEGSAWDEAMSWDNL